MKNLTIKKILTVALSATLLAGLLTGCQKADADKGAADIGKTKIYAVTGASPRPFSYYGDDNSLVGHNIELTEAIFEKLPQYELVWEVTDFPSIFAGLDSDKYQLGVNNFGMNEERKEKYLFTSPTFANELIVVANKDIDLGEITDYPDLAGKTFIGQAGVFQTTLVENYNNEHPDAQITIEYTDADLNIQLDKVASGAVDFTTIDAPMYYGYYQPEFNYDLNTSSLAGHTSTDGLFSYLIVSKGNEQLVDEINAAWYEVVKEGKSKEICEKYFTKDYSPALEDLAQPK